MSGLIDHGLEGGVAHLGQDTLAEFHKRNRVDGSQVSHSLEEAVSFWFPLKDKTRGTSKKDKPPSWTFHVKAAEPQHPRLGVLLIGGFR